VAAALEGNPHVTTDGDPGGARFNIGIAAARSGVSAKMVRHYEALGLLPAVDRTEAGYRLYTDREVHTLRFIRRARDLGFSMAEIAELLRLWQDRARASASVRRIASRHVEELERKIAELTTMRRTLEQLVACCHGDGRPDCPILEELEGVPREHSGGVPRA
jgi:MerR family copper efflux transcriptional regulator